MPIAYLTRRTVIACAHRLYSDALSHSENALLFGPCAYENFHGHNYEILVTLKGKIDPKTGILFDLTQLKKIIHDQITLPMDHRNLNLDVPAFKTLNPTVENIAVVIWQALSPSLPKGLLFEVQVFETENNIARYRGE
jgi:6-pyruvoyltetrahydropterin/6-carboxytetrahydropterin synthase